MTIIHYILTMGTTEEVCIRCRGSGEVLDVPYSCAEEGTEVDMSVILCISEITVMLTSEIL